MSASLLDPALLKKSAPDALKKLDPRTLWHNPVMLIVEIGAVFTTVEAVAHPSAFAWLIVVWLWLTVLFANLAEAVAEGRGKAQAAGSWVSSIRGSSRPAPTRGAPCCASGATVWVVIG